MSVELRKVKYDSPEAAKFVTGLSGWVSATGHFWGDDEHMARYQGCTHTLCRTCGAETEKHWLLCRDCRDKADMERFAACERREWDGKQMIYSETRDEYYESPEDAEETLEDGESLEDLRLMLCDPNYARTVDPDYFCDELPEDGDLPAEVETAMEAFNKAVEGIVLSWSPGKYALGVVT